MERNKRNNSKVRVFFIKILKILLTPIGRLRKLTRKYNIRQIKITTGIGVTIISIALVAYMYRSKIKVKHTDYRDSDEEPTPSPHIIGTPLRRVPLDEIYKDLVTKEDKDYVIDDEQKEPAGMVNTPGCKIPIAMIDYEKYIENGTQDSNKKCGNRAVFLRKYGNDKVIARIKTYLLKKYAKHNNRIQCCYQFIVDSTQYPHGRPKLIFSNCTDFRDETIITLQSDFINVICSEYDSNDTQNIIYDDMYAFSKKIEYSKPKTRNCKVTYNVLILGMDSMSLPRAVKTMPRTVAYLKDDSWLGFRGYHKIADNSLPNIMAALTGKNMSSIIEECFGSMDDCNYLLIWNAFKEAGYVTAYGEDNIRLANTFTKEYAFRKTPTDHYMQPFYLKEESNRKNNSLSCAGKVSSGQQLLDYALDFANTYKKDSFFGFFWINSFSYDEKSRPEDADKIIENFMNQLSYTGIMSNTFIMFISDHGLRFGSHRLKVESYYDDRMPMNFIWIPLIFKGKHPYLLSAMVVNQHRLVTPYDIYSTLLDIKKMSLCSNFSASIPEGCPNCHSLFQVITSNRTCHDAAINEKWCSCHKLYPLPVQDPIGIKSVNAVVSYIKSMVMTIETQQCWTCMIPSLKEVNRIHFYYDEDKVNIYYVVAITMSPGNGTYEATVLRKDGYTIIGPLSFISYYKGLGKCALNRSDRLFCVCQKHNHC